ncbi:crossover junction endodeoxyribonuclease RuvC [Marinomonas sp. TI.3.20]|uniref:crossover junction endodeoxyribonuclease RuvC n=1 Tax=Marinomonas sp. TI.3.20 TaxID=3121296 RepID=UPI00311DC007
MKKYLLAIDPGSRKFGFAVFSFENGDQHELIEFGTVVISKPTKQCATTSIYERLRLIGEFVETICCKYSIDEFAIEEAFLGKNTDSTIKMSMARGAFICTISKATLNVYEYPATKVKQIGALNAKATKDDVISTIKMIYSLRDITEDAADAVAIGRTHLILRHGALSRAHQLFTTGVTSGAFRRTSTSRGSSRRSTATSRDAMEKALLAKGLIKA